MAELRAKTSCVREKSRRPNCLTMDKPYKQCSGRPFKPRSIDWSLQAPRAHAELQSSDNRMLSHLPDLAQGLTKIGTSMENDT